MIGKTASVRKYGLSFRLWFATLTGETRAREGYGVKQTMKKELFSKQMSRREFLQLAGVVLLSAIGITNFMNNMKNHVNGTTTRTIEVKSGRGFGSSKFGA